MKKLLNKFSFICLFLLSANHSIAQSSLSVYFSNDSMNGFKLSDAYETHNMGIVYSESSFYAMLDLGIVTPDMWVYRNEYRKANRAFGELVTLEVGSPSHSNDLNTYVRITSAGKFGLDKAQDAVHNILSLQPVEHINELVRMPDAVWVGVGGRYLSGIDGLLHDNAQFELDAYYGSDRSSLRFSIADKHIINDGSLVLRFGAMYVGHDNIVTAGPINARLRLIVPEASVQLNYDFDGYSIYFRESFSMPTIAEDEELYAVLSAGISLNF